jgi:hypothetical protein
MKARIKIALMITLLIATHGSLYIAGVYVMKRNMAELLYDTQGRLAFNHYSVYVKIKSLIDERCIDTATDLLLFHIDSEKSHIKHFSSLNRQGNLISYINKRDPGLLKSLEGFTSGTNEMILEHDECKYM